MTGILKRTGLMTALLLVMILVHLPGIADAQCAMCTAAAESATEDGNKQGLGLNDGILMLLAMPYIAAIVIGVLWYRNSKYKKIKQLNLD